MHNLYVIFSNFIKICKWFEKSFENDKGNQTRRGVISRFSDLEVIALSSLLKPVE